MGEWRALLGNEAMASFKYEEALLYDGGTTSRVWEDGRDEIAVDVGAIALRERWVLADELLEIWSKYS